MKKNMIITGSTGYVPNFFYKKLKNKYKIIRLSRYPNIQKNIFSYNHNIKNKKIFALLHIAYSSPQSNSDKNKILEENQNIDKNVLNLIKNNNISKIIFFSSTSIFQNSKKKTLKDYKKSKITMEENLKKLKKKNLLFIRVPSLLYLNGRGNWINKLINNIKFNRKTLLFNKNNLFNNCINIDELYKIVLNFLSLQKNTENLVINPKSIYPIKIFNIYKILKKKYFYAEKIKFVNTKEKSRLNLLNESNLKTFRTKYISTALNIKNFIKNYLSLKNKKIIILGSKGYIGKNLLKNKKLNIEGFSSKNYNFYKKYNFHLLKKINDADLIIFLLTSKKYNKNIFLIHNLINQIDCTYSKKIIYLSTTKLYGKFYDQNAKMHLEREMIIQKYFPINHLILRIPSIFGNIEKNKEYPQFTINNYIIKLLKNINIKIYSSLKNEREYLYMDSFKKIFFQILESDLHGTHSIYLKNKISFENLFKILKNRVNSRTKIIKSNSYNNSKYPKYLKLKNFETVNKIFSIRNYNYIKFIKKELNLIKI